MKTSLWIPTLAVLMLASPAGFQATAKAQPQKLQIGDGSHWHFLGGQWNQDAGGIITPPDKRNLHSRAFDTEQAYSDFSSEFEFNGNYRENGTGGAGLIFRATDANHFYMVYFPWGAQQLRAKHFWAHLIKVDGDGYLRSIQAAWVPGVPSETDRWYKVRVEAKGPDIDVWVDGRRALSATDDSYKSGAMGLAGYGWYFFRNVNISGEKSTLAAWDREQEIPVHHFTVGLNSNYMPSTCLLSNGDVIVAANDRLVRSTDKGRTWGEAEGLPNEKLGVISDYGNSMFCTAKGRLIIHMFRDREVSEKEASGKPMPEILISESKDNGLTWSDPSPKKIGGPWPERPSKLVAYGPLVETADGSLLRFLLGTVGKHEFYPELLSWGSAHIKAYAIRSTDGGESWSAPIELDRPAWNGIPRGSIPGSLDFTEPTGVAMGNQMTVLVRPIYSAYMWQCWSNDGGASWDAASRTTFPGYAQSMLRTQSGAIFCSHRYPQYAVNLSHDNGLNWDHGTIIGYEAWANGSAVEVEPNVVLCTYMNAERDMPLLVQLIRVTPDGILPVAREQ